MPHRSTRQHPEYFLSAFASIGLILVMHGLWLSHLQGGGMVDDAYITFRYVDQLLAGAGPVFNPGQKVEGYSNFLWMVLLVPIRALTRPLELSIEPPVIVLGLTLGLGLLWQAARLTERLTGAPWLALGCALILATDGSFARWCIDGLETPLFALLLAQAMLSELDERQQPQNPAFEPPQPASPTNIDHRNALWRPRFPVLALRAGLVRLRAMFRELSRPGLWLGLACLTRPEGLGAVGLFGLYRLTTGFRNLFQFTSQPGPVGRTLEERSPTLLDPRLWRDLLRLILTAGLLVGPHLLFRRLYYDAWVPNTAWIKVHPGLVATIRGLRYGVMFLSARGPLLLAVGLAWLLGVGLRRRAGPPGRWPLTFPRLMVLGFSAYAVLVGGDWMGWGRFFVPVGPLLALLWVESLARGLGGGQAGRGYPRSALTALMLLAACLGNFVTSSLLDEGVRMQKAGRELAERRAIVDWLRTHSVPDQVLLTEEIGYIPFHTGLVTLDVYGLIDPHIAQFGEYDPDSAPGHQKADLNYSLSLKPDFLVMADFHATWQRNVDPTTQSPRYPALKEYEPIPLALPEGRLEIYQRRKTSP